MPFLPPFSAKLQGEEIIDVGKGDEGFEAPEDETVEGGNDTFEEDEEDIDELDKVDMSPLALHWWEEEEEEEEDDRTGSVPMIHGFMKKRIGAGWGTLLVGCKLNTRRSLSSPPCILIRYVKKQYITYAS